MTDEEKIEVTACSEPVKIAMNRKIYNEILGVVEEFALEVNGYDLDDCRDHFDSLAEKHDKFNCEKVKDKMTSNEQKF